MYSMYNMYTLMHSMYVCTVCMYVCMYTLMIGGPIGYCVRKYVYPCFQIAQSWQYVCMYVCICMHVYVCMYVYSSYLPLLLRPLPPSLG